MKHLKKSFALILVIIICFSCFITNANAADVVGKALIINNSGYIAGSGTMSSTITFSKLPTMYGYIVLPDVDKEHSSYVYVTITHGLEKHNYKLLADGTYHSVNLNDITKPTSKGPWTVTWSGAQNIYYISLTFGA